MKIANARQRARFALQKRDIVQIRQCVEAVLRLVSQRESEETHSPE
jgi:hypothetical protein